MVRHWANCSLLGLLAFGIGVHAIGQATCVSFTPSSSSFAVVSNRTATPVFLSDDEWPGVQRAASDFAADIERVTGVSPALYNYSSSTTSSIGSSTAIIVGTLGQSSLIDQIVNATNLDVTSVEGQWEAFLSKEVANPLPGISSAYVIIGADKRGTIYGLYDHSEQFGVSPWYWWADVPTTPNSEIYVTLSGCAHGSPTVQYRGIFLNDEQPALQSWAMVRFTNGTGAPLTGHRSTTISTPICEDVSFELLLRIKANYFAFGALADLYGIVMGTSHEEPMMRSIPVDTNAENLYNFWVEGAERAKPYENMFTVGMRGDEPISGGQDISLLEGIIQQQRTILSNTYPGKNVSTIPQMWCLYKEVIGYYEDGMTVPDDIALLWTDDNYGNVERYPVISERNRSGGAGVYYHVGSPRNYKWITTYEQMSLAVDRNATRIWIVNVGDLKPYEMQIEFFIAYGWDASLWNMNNLDSFVLSWAQREFDLSATDAQDVVDIIAFVSRFNSNRKPELLNATTYSLYNYREAENVLAGWDAVNKSATRIRDLLSSEMQPAYFELVYHPVQASYTLANMWISAGYNNLRASQALISANNYGTQVASLFEQDYALEVEYHSILDVRQHREYPADRDVTSMPVISWVQAKKQALSGAMRIVPEGTAGAWCALSEQHVPVHAGYGCPNPTLYLDNYVPAGNRYFLIGAGGPTPFNYTATSNATWLTLSPTGTYRVYASVDWAQVTGVQYALITFNATVPEQPPMSFTATFVAMHNEVPSDFVGFVEGDGGVSIEAGHAARNTSVDGITWTLLPGYGRTQSGVTPWPRGGTDQNYTVGSGPSIEYDFYTFDAENVTVTAYVSPSLNALGPDRPLALGMQVDADTPQVRYYIPNATPGALPNAWNEWVSDNIVTVPMNFTASPGAHTLTVSSGQGALDCVY
ncbi:hypothetical protein B0H21DRAFT_747405 [Amylocystis lapponica]|nr:hypothetical protein B0H21DRAFT_747405 [Amylocystis lapponica]